MQISSWIQLCIRELEGTPIKEHSDIDASFAESERFSKWKASKREVRLEAVSYTHLTLPTSTTV